MATIKIRHHISGYRALRSAPGVVADLESRARRVQEAAGGRAAGYEMSSMQGAASPQGRWRTTVVTATRKAMLENARRNTLLRAMDAARG